jgi:hypothetical protein
MVHIEHDHDKTGDPDRQATDIQDRDQQVLPYVAERHFQIVLDHISSGFPYHSFN